MDKAEIELKTELVKKFLDPYGFSSNMHSCDKTWINFTRQERPMLNCEVWLETGEFELSYHINNSILRIVTGKCSNIFGKSNFCDTYSKLFRTALTIENALK